MSRRSTSAVLVGDGKTATVTLGTGQSFTTADGGAFLKRLDKQLLDAGFARSGYRLGQQDGQRVLVAYITYFD